MSLGKPATVVLLAWSLLAPVKAGAAYDPVGSGTTKLELAPSFLEFLHREGVNLEAVSPAGLHGRTISFPAAEGKFDPVSEKGTLRHEGAIVFSKGGRHLPLKALQLKTTAKHAPLSAKLGGGQLKLATASGLKVSRSGFGDRVRIAALTLSAKVATRFAKKLDLRGAIEAGQPLGRTSTRIQPQTVALLQTGKVELTLDPVFEAKLKSLFVAVNPIFPAEHPGPFTLPIFGGQMAPNGSEGTAATRGSIEFLQLGGGQVFWTESSLDLASHLLTPEIDVEPAPPYAGKVGPVAAAAVGSAPFSADPKTRGFSMAGAALTLSAATADTFNQVFAGPQGREAVFVAGEPMGSISFRAEGQ